MHHKKNNGIDHVWGIIPCIILHITYYIQIYILEKHFRVFFYIEKKSMGITHTTLTCTPLSLQNILHQSKLELYIRVGI